MLSAALERSGEWGIVWQCGLVEGALHLLGGGKMKSELIRLLPALY